MAYLRDIETPKGGNTMRKLYHVTARNASNATVWAAHLWANSPTEAKEIAAQFQISDAKQFPNRVVTPNDIPAAWIARPSKSFENASNQF